MTLGRYELILRVAVGGMGEVWAARLRREHGFQKLFALKVHHPELPDQPEVQRMFLDEAMVAARIRHPNVVPVVDLGEDGGRLFLVMEWVSGEPLASALRGARGRPAPPIVAARIAYQICAGLDAAHELCDDHGAPLGLVHCDVSPDNILITSEGLVRLVDFGVALYEGAPPSGQRGVDVGPSSGERGPALRGKAPYMAPEHILGRQSDRRADLFAVGIILYELLAGAHPFLADNDHITMSRIVNDAPVQPLSSRPGWRRRLSAPPPEPIPPALERLVAAALSKSPEERPATAAGFMRALEEAVPGAALQSNDALVARWLREVLGDALQLRAQKLREALEALERGLVPRAQDGRSGALEVSDTTGGGLGNRSDHVVARGARAGAAAVVATVACALVGLTAIGDSPLRAHDPEREPPSSRDPASSHRAARAGPAELRLRAAGYDDRPMAPERATPRDVPAPRSTGAAPRPAPSPRRGLPAKPPSVRREYKPRGL